MATKTILACSLVSLSGLLAACNVTKVDGNTMAEKNGCFGCHAIDHIIVGPAWKDVAAKYKKEPDAEKKLMQSLMAGSSGKWGSKVHMQAQKQLSEAEAHVLVRYILSLEK